MATPYEGIAARLNFSKPGRAACKAWPKQKLEDGRSVGEHLEALEERPAFQVAFRGDWFVELQGVVAASDIESIAAQVAGLAAAAAAKGAHAEWARFPWRARPSRVRYGTASGRSSSRPSPRLARPGRLPLHPEGAARGGEEARAPTTESTR
ncbi:hypothetical protein ACN28S_32085 [Cystobacter fuscus]